MMNKTSKSGCIRSEANRTGPILRGVNLFGPTDHRAAQNLRRRQGIAQVSDSALSGLPENLSVSLRSYLLDQRHRLSIATVYEPNLGRRFCSSLLRTTFSGWKLSSVVHFASGRPFAALVDTPVQPRTLALATVWTRT